MLGIFDGMTFTERYAQVDKLKDWLNRFHPLLSVLVDELKQLFDMRFTYNFSAIERNTLIQSKAQLMLGEGITVDGKVLKDYLEVTRSRCD